MFGESNSSCLKPVVLHDRVIVIGCVHVQSVHLVESVSQTLEEKNNTTNVKRQLIHELSFGRSVQILKCPPEVKKLVSH